VPLVDLPEEEEMAAAVARIDAWAERELASGGFLVAAERQEVTDRTASFQWYLRFKGDEKDFITVWFTLKQRTLHHEAQFMPAPEANKEDVYAYLMRRNTHLFGMCFALGPEDAVYLVGRVPARLVDDEELDRIAGSSVLYTDDHFPTAMTMGHPATYRRRPRR
jgi:Putative bacterial sensory transduction regulator